jgi:hypothetical protein
VETPEYGKIRVGVLGQAGATEITREEELGKLHAKVAQLAGEQESLSKGLGSMSIEQRP